MKNKIRWVFWNTMSWIDTTVVHTIWDILAGKDNNETPFDELFWRFCQWSQIGLYLVENPEDKE